MITHYDTPIAFGSRVFNLLTPLFGDAIGKAAFDLCRGTGGAAWPVSRGRGGGRNLTPVSARHIVGLLLAAMGRGGPGHQGRDIVSAYERVAAIALAEKGSALLVLSELFARHVLGLDGFEVLEEFAETGAWLSVRQPGDLIKIHTSYDRALPEKEFVLCTPYGEPDPRPLSLSSYRSIRISDFLGLAEDVRGHGMATKPLPMGMAA